MHRDEISIDPTDGLEMPAIRGRRERVASRAEAASLIAALPHDERAFWATAFYAGLRRGELRALRWSDVDLRARPALIHVRRTWDDKEGEVEVKTDAGFRTVPVTVGLFDLLFAHQIATGRAGERPRVRPHPCGSVRELHRAQSGDAGLGLEGAAQPGPGRPED